MDHVRKRHHKTSESAGSTVFHPGVKPKTLVKEVLRSPVWITPHLTNPRRTWLFKEFGYELGKRGYDKAPCCWLAVLIERGALITAYPVPHPLTMKCVRNAKKC